MMFKVTNDSNNFVNDNMLLLIIYHNDPKS